MKKPCSRGSVLFLCMLLNVSCISFAAATTTGTLISLPACGNNPNENTKLLQAQIDLAHPEDTLVLPAGVCVVARCDLAQGHMCYGVDGRPHRSALYIGNKTNVSLVGAANGASVLKLDPTPPGAPGHHAYCGDTHVLSIQLSRFITLRDFTVDGSDSQLPHDHSQCPPNPRLGSHSGAIDEHLHDVRVLNTTDLTIDHMRLTEAHGDGLNLAAEHTQLTIPNTERITVTTTDFLGNDRSGLAFQRNVGFVTIQDDYFRNSGNDQDLDMEPTGGPNDLGPYEVDIHNNLFERLQPKIAVALGATGGMQPSRGVRFTSNTIRAVPSTPPQPGGCISVYAADQTLIADNTVIGAPGCITVAAQKVTNLQIENNHLESYVNLSDKLGRFVPLGVVDVRERVVNRGDTTICGAPPKSPCPYFIHYPDRTTVKGNTIIQHVQHALGVRLSNADESVIADNTIEFTNEVAPVGVTTASAHAIGIEVPFGVQSLPSYGFYENERTQFTGWTISGNQLSQFADGIHLRPIKAGVRASAISLTTNVFNTNLPDPRGLYLEGAPQAPQAEVISTLFVNKNAFGCGFDIGPFPTLVFPLNAFVHPSGQPHTGNIGVVIPCQ